MSVVPFVYWKYYVSCSMFAVFSAQSTKVHNCFSAGLLRFVCPSRHDEYVFHRIFSMVTLHIAQNLFAYFRSVSDLCKGFSLSKKLVLWLCFFLTDVQCIINTYHDFCVIFVISRCLLFNWNFTILIVDRKTTKLKWDISMKNCII